MINSILKTVRKNVSNIPGWRTSRHIVVIESDDWGSNRMPSKESFDCLVKNGIPVDKDHFCTYDSLESNTDLEQLFELLSKYRDSTGRCPVITGVNVVANPNFQQINENEFSEFVYEPFTETCMRMDDHDRVLALWQKGINDRLMIPIFHGREHLNVQFLMRALRKGHKSTLLAFSHGVTGIPRIGINNEEVPDFQAAFQIDTLADLPYQKEVIRTGLDLFEKLYGFRTTYFVPTNGPFNNSLEKQLNASGIKYINTGKRQMEPIGNGQHKLNKRYLGERNAYGQYYLTRNCGFEPSSCGYECRQDFDWVDNCLKEIEIAFRWHKPATISSHRVNYIGYLHPENRENGLRQLKELLSRMLKRWPDIEFMTSVELGDLIASTQK